MGELDACPHAKYTVAYHSWHGLPRPDCRGSHLPVEEAVGPLVPAGDRPPSLIQSFLDWTKVPALLQ